MAYAFKRQEWVRVDTSVSGSGIIDITTPNAYVSGDLLFLAFATTCASSVSFAATPTLRWTVSGTLHTLGFVLNLGHFDVTPIVSPGDNAFIVVAGRALVTSTIPAGSTFRFTVPTTGFGHSYDPSTVASVLLVFNDPTLAATVQDYEEDLPYQDSSTSLNYSPVPPDSQPGTDTFAVYTGTVIDSTPTPGTPSPPYGSMIATTTADDLLFGAIRVAEHVTFTPEAGKGWHVAQIQFNDSHIKPTGRGTLIVQWRVVTVTGTYFWKGTIDASGTWGMTYEARGHFSDTRNPLGCDLVATPAALLRSYAKADGTAWVDTAPLVGTPWTAVQIASALPSDAFPTLCVFRDEHRHYVFAFFHDASGATQIFVTENDGGSWVGISSKAGLKFPRGVALTGCVLLAGHDGTHLKVYRTEDFFVTLTEVFSTTVGAELVGLRADRRGRVHMVTPAMGHTVSTDGVTWTAAGSLGGGTLGAFDYEFPHGAMFYWAGSILEVQPTDEKYDALAGSPTSLAALSLPVQQLGATYDRNGVAWLFGLRDDASKHIYWSRDEAAFTEIP